MDGWEWVVATGYLAGGVLPVVGFVRARGALDRAVVDIERRRSAGGNGRLDRGSYDDVSLLPLTIRSQVYAHARADLRGPALWVLGGVALGTAASIGSLLL